MSADLWFWFGMAITTLGVAVFWIHRVETRRARRLDEEERQRRLKQELRQSLAHMAPPMGRRNGGDRA
jgi:heme exporter protein D